MKDSEANWRQRARCRLLGADLFFPVGTTGPAVLDIAAAKTVCAECVVRPECLKFALRTNQEVGVWGGTTEEERRELRKALDRARRPSR